LLNYNHFLCVFQEIKDTVDGQRILEKKGSSAVSRQSSQKKKRWVRAFPLSISQKVN